MRFPPACLSLIAALGLAACSDNGGGPAQPLQITSVSPALRAIQPPLGLDGGRHTPQVMHIP